MLETDFPLNLLNDKERAPETRHSIGITLCAEKMAWKSNTPASQTESGIDQLFRAPKIFRSDSAMGRSLMLAKRRRM